MKQLVRPLPFLAGTYRSVTRNRLALRAAFAIDATLGRRRNAGLEPELHLPLPRLISKAATLRLFPGIARDGLTVSRAGLLWRLGQPGLHVATAYRPAVGFRRP